jgi:hypothetical protein
VEVKGTALVVVPLFIRKIQQDTGLQKWLNTLSDDARALFSGSISVNLWYDYQKYLVLPTQKMCDLFYAGSIQGAAELGTFSAEYALRGFYKVFVKIGTPEFILKKGIRILPTYYHPSEIEIPVITPGRAVVQIKEFPEMHAVVEQRIIGWIKKALEISGAKNVVIEITDSLLKNNPLTEFIITWKH